jgi:hypothetical protein
MTQELLYTSAPRGLLRGSSGFCTVAATAKMPPSLMQKLESLSGYRHIFPPSDPRAARNPINWSHLRITVNGKDYHVLSRVAFAGRDHTNRTNHIAHHVVLEDSDDLPACGPARLLRQQGFMLTEWDGQVGPLPPAGPLPVCHDSPRICLAWERRTGDAGWGGLLAEWLHNDYRQPVCLVFDPATDSDLLPLIEESLTLLPPALRWQTTFSTYYSGTQNIACVLRGISNDSPEAQKLPSGPQARVLVLSVISNRAPMSQFVESARSGTLPSPSLKIGTTAETTAEWELAVHPAQISSRRLPHTELKGSPLTPSPKSGSDYGFAGRQTESTPPPIQPPVFQRTRSTMASSWILGLSALCLLLLFSLGSAVIYIFTANNAREKASEVQLPGSQRISAAAPLPSRPHSDLKLELEEKNKELTTKLGAAEEKVKELNKEVAKLAMTITLTWLKTKLAKALEQSNQQLLEQKKISSNALAPGKDAAPGPKPVVEASLKEPSQPAQAISLKRVRHYCSIPAIKQPDGTEKISDAKALTIKPTLQLDDFESFQLKIRANVQVPSQSVKIEDKPNGKSLEILAHKSGGKRTDALLIAKFSLQGNEIRFQWQQGVLSLGEDRPHVERCIKNSVLQIVDAKGKTNLVGLKKPVQVQAPDSHIDPVYLPANGDDYVLALGSIDESELSRDLFVESASLEICKAQPTADSVQIRDKMLGVKMKLSVQREKQSTRLSLHLARNSDKTAEEEDPPIFLGSCVICSRLGDLAVEELRYTSAIGQRQSR